MDSGGNVNEPITIVWLEGALSSKEKWKAKAKEILDALQKQEVETVADLQRASATTWERVRVDGERLPGAIEDLITSKATAPPPVPQGTEDIGELQKAFNSEYIDKYKLVDALGDKIVSVVKSWKESRISYYAPYFALFQSSGYGKSRLLCSAYTYTKCNIYSVYMTYKNNGQTVYIDPPAIGNHFLRNLKSILLRSIKALVHCIQNNIAPSDKFCESEHFKRDDEIKEEKFYDECNTLTSGLKGNNSILLITVDEAGALLQPENETSFFRMFRKEIKKLAEKCPSLRLCAIVTDTLSTMSNFAPVATKDSSLRPSSNELFPPFIYVLTTDLYSLDNPLVLGRALWGAMLTGGVLATDQALVSFAIQKLLGGSYDSFNKVPQKEQGSAAIAILASRCALNISPCISAELIRSNMGTCTSVSSNCEIVTVSYPSEPVLAEAAAQLMDDKETLLSVIQCFYASFCRGYVEPGGMGEVAARIILLRCFDSFAAKDSLKTHTNVTVSKFFQLLVGSRPDFETDLLNGKISFTHFIEMVESQIPVSTLEVLYKRRAAIILKKGTKASDLLIPVRCDDNSYTFIVIQVKNVAIGNSKKSQSQILTEMKPEDVVEEFPDTRPFARVLFRLQVNAECKASKTPKNAVVVLGYDRSFISKPVKEVLSLILDNTTDKLLVHVPNNCHKYVKLMFPVRYNCKQTANTGKKKNKTKGQEGETNKSDGSKKRKDQETTADSDFVDDPQPKKIKKLTKSTTKPASESTTKLASKSTPGTAPPESTTKPAPKSTHGTAPKSTHVLLCPLA